MRIFVMFVILIHLVLFGDPCSPIAEDKRLFLYTSIKENLIEQLRDQFIKKYADIELDYYFSGAGKLLTKISNEQKIGKIVADVFWTTEVLDFIQLRQMGVLEKYQPPESKRIISPMKDPDGFFTPVRLATLGIAYNTKRVADPPKSWQDLLDPRFKDGLGIPNPAFSGTACVSMAMIVNNMGWDYIEKLKANGAKMYQGMRGVIDDTVSGELKASIAADYIAVEKIEKGANLGFMYPKEMLVIPSPVAIFKGTPNLKAAQKFVDFLLTKEGQEIIASTGTLPIREDVPIRQGFNLIPPKEARKRAMKIDYVNTLHEKEALIQNFTAILRGR